MPNQLPENNFLLTIKQAADKLGVSTKTLRRWEKAGRLIPQRTIGNQRRYTISQINDLRNGNSKVPVKPSLSPLSTIRTRLEERLDGARKSQIQNLASQGETLQGWQEKPRQHLPGFLFGFFSVLVFSLLVTQTSLGSFLANKLISTPAPGVSSSGIAQSNVLAEETTNTDFSFNVNVPATFNENALFTKNLEVRGNLTAPNIISSIIAGSGITVGGGQNPTITNTGVLSLGGKTGALKLEEGTGITIDGLKITAKDISLVAGTGISVSGYTITNNDPGSSQKIFKTINVDSTLFSAGTNTDTLKFISGTNITLTPDTTGKSITVDLSAAGLSSSGWTDDGTIVRLVTLTDKVGIGTTSPATPLHVVGATTLAGNVTLGAAISDNITFSGRVTSGNSLVPQVDLGSDLGASSFRFNNLYVGNINSNAGMSTAGQALFTYSPLDTTYAQTSVMINPTTAIANSYLLGIGVGGTKYQRFGVDAEGDLSVGYSDAVTIPVSDYPLSVYGHSGTRVASVDTVGNMVITGSLTTQGGSTVSGDLTIHAGNSIIPSADQVNAISIANAASVDFVSFDTLNSRVGIGTTVPGSTLSVANNLAVGSTYALVAAPGNGAIFEGNVGIGTSSPVSLLDVNHLFNVFSNGNIGIGTTAPNSKLEILGTGSNQLRLAYSSSYYTNLFVDSTGMLSIAPNGTLAASFSDTQNTFAQPTQFTASGDVSIANDLQFTNPSVSTIRSLAPLVLEVGENFNSSTLTLKTYNSGQLVLDLAGGLSLIQAQRWTVPDATTSALIMQNTAGTILNIDSTNSRLGIGTTIPGATLDIAGSSTTSGDLTFRGSGTAHLINLYDNGSLQIGNSVGGGTATPTFFVSSTGNVGIGTTNPVGKLNVSGSTSPQIRLSSTTEPNEYYSTISINTSQSNRFNISDRFGEILRTSRVADGSLKTGIGGVTSPIATLQVTGNSALTTDLAFLAGPTATGLAVQQNGNVGIGNTAPTSALDVTGNLNIGGTLSGGYATMSSSLAVGFSSVPAGVGNAVFAGNVGIGTSTPNARLRIDQSGEKTTADYGAYIANTSVSSTDSVNKYGLYISSTGVWNGVGANNYGLYVASPTGGANNYTALFAGSLGNTTVLGTGAEIDFSRAAANYLTASNASGSLVFRTGGTNSRMTIDNLGNVGIGVTAPAEALDVAGKVKVGDLTAAGGGSAVLSSGGILTTVSSSQRYKENVTDFGLALDTINKLRPVDFIWKDNTLTPGMKDFGLIAEEVAQIAPALVTYESDNTTIRGVKYEKLPILLIKAMQEQQSQINNQSITLNTIKESLGQTESVEITRTPALEVDNALNMNIIKNLETQGALIVNGPATFKAETIFEKLITFLGEVIFKGKVTFQQPPVFSQDTAGFAIIKKGDRLVKITFEKEYEEVPVVNADNLWNVDNATLSVIDALSGFFYPKSQYVIAGLTTKGFSIVLEDPAIVDMKFSWTAIAVKGAKTFESTPSAQLLSSPAPSATSSSELMFPTSTPLPTAAITATPVLTATPTPTQSVATPTPSPSPTATPKPTATPTPKIKTITVLPNDYGFVRVRDNPSLDAAEIDQVPCNTTYPYLQEQYGWYQISYEGKTGWVSGIYVKVN